jgi:hypothetical protein
MFTHNRLRFQSTVVELLILLQQQLDQGDINMDIPHAASAPDISYASTASAPSLRARESTATMTASAASYLPAEEGQGNVKVVVRVRKFLPRGRRHTVPSGDQMVNKSEQNSTDKRHA